MEVTLEKFSGVFLKLSWTWLNDPEVKFLINGPDITKKRQQEWFNSLRNRKDYLIWGIKVDSIPIGACGLKNITNVDCEYWGYIGEKFFWGKGIGKTIMYLLEEKARSLGKSSVWLQVIKENTRAISLYNRQGYMIESETDSLYIMKKQL